MNQVGLNSNKIANFKSVQAMQMQQQIPQMQPEQPLPDVQLPPIYAASISKPDTRGFKESLKKMDVMGLIYPWFEHPLLMLGTCAGLAWGVDKFSSACGGEYETSLVGKAARFGDRIEESKFVKSKPFQTVLGWGKTAKNKLKHIFRNSDIVNAIGKTPSQPEWGFVKDELLNMQQRVIRDFSRVTNTLKLTGDGFAELTKLGLDKSDNEFLKDFFKGAQITEEKASNAIQLKRIGLSNDAINDIIHKPEATSLVKAKQLEKLGIDAEFLKKLDKNPATPEDIVKVREACKKAKGMRIGAGYQKLLGRFQPFARKIGLDEIGNRLTSMSEAKTATGRAMATFLQKCHRGFTFGGGKMGVLLFVSPLLVETMMNVKKAEPNQKLGTAAHGTVHSISWVFTFPLALSILHRFGGIQYAGMSKEDVEKCRELIKKFNEKANPYKEKSWRNFFGSGEKKAVGETFQSFDEYKAAKDVLKKELNTLRSKNVKNQNLLTKISKQIGKFLTMDLENISSYKNGHFLANKLRGIPSFLRNFCGVPLRVGLWAALTMGVLDTIINKGIKFCFGNFYDGMKEEEHDENKKTQKEFLKQDLHARLLEAQRQKVYGAANPVEETPLVPEPQMESVQQQQLSAVEEFASKVQQTEPELKQEETAAAQPAVQPEIKQDMPQEVKQDIQSQIEESKPAPIQTPVQAQVPVNEPVQKPAEVIKPVDTNTYIPKETSAFIKPAQTVKRDNYTYIPSSENVLKKEEKESDTNKYIPSQNGAQFNKTFDNSGLEAALKRADRAEQRAIQTLAGNFNSL